jgi:hypothetical protein
LDVAAECHDAASRTDPEEIALSTFDDMLGVLPPVGWRNDGPAESFKLSERTSGSITGIYVRVGDRYFTFKDSITLPHAECCERVRQSKIFHEPAPLDTVPTI